MSAEEELNNALSLVGNVEPAEAMPELKTGTAPERKMEEPKKTEPEKGKTVFPHDFKHLKDYRKRSFSPEIHAVDPATGKPKLNSDGTLVILRRKNKAKELLDTLRNVPVSDHEKEKEEKEREEQQGAAQAVALVEDRKRKISAEVTTELYFQFGSMIFSSEFLKNKKERKRPLVEAVEEYEIRTGKRFDLPPGVALSLAFLADTSQQVYQIEECAARKDVILGKLKNLSFVKRFSRKKKPLKDTENMPVPFQAEIPEGV